MKEISCLRDIQRIEYNILCRTVDFFEAHGISYFLCGGTLLGAIRHGGFIPWDDDIDILVPREDYERFRALVRNGKFNNETYAARLPGDKGYRYPFVKIMDLRTQAQEGVTGEKTQVWIDVFPLEHLPDNSIDHKRYCRKMVLLTTLLNAPIIEKARRRSFFKRIACKAITWLHHLAGGAEKISVIIDKASLRTNQTFQTSLHCGQGALNNGLKDYYESNRLLPAAEAIFEGRRFRIPHDYDHYLSNMYGDYMTPPPEDQRQLQHQLRAWWIQEPESDMKFSF